ncbi:MAG: phosphotransferase, partial [Actinomycetes bacterium]
AALIEAVRRATREVDGAPLVPPVVGEWSDLGLLVQPAVSRATELHGLVGSLSAGSASVSAVFADAGSALAALHECSLPPEAPVRTFLDDIRELRGYRPAIAAADAATAARFTALVDTLEAAGSSTPEDVVTSHGAFRTDQLIAGEDRLMMIDLDTVCRSERARDIGNLLGYLDWKAIRRPDLAEMLAAVRDGFLAGYARRLPLLAPARVTVNRAASLAKIAGRRFRGLTVTEWHLVPSLLSAAERLASVPQMEPT